MSLARRARGRWIGAPTRTRKRADDPFGRPADAWYHYGGAAFARLKAPWHGGTVSRGGGAGDVVAGPDVRQGGTGGDAARLGRRDEGDPGRRRDRHHASAPGAWVAEGDSGGFDLWTDETWGAHLALPRVPAAADVTLVRDLGALFDGMDSAAGDLVFTRQVLRNLRTGSRVEVRPLQSPKETRPEVPSEAVQSRAPEQ